MARGPWIAHLNPCHKLRMLTTKNKSHFYNTGHLSGNITKAYQFTEFNQNILICTISMYKLFTQPKRSWVCKRPKFTCIMFFTSFFFNLIYNMTFFRKKCFDHSIPSRICCPFYGGGSVVDDSLLIVTPTVGLCGCSVFRCALLCVHSSFAIISMGKRELVALLCFSSWCLMIVLTMPRVCLQFVIVVFPNHTHLRFCGCVKGQNICLHCALCFIPVNLICNMTTFRK